MAVLGYWEQPEEDRPPDEILGDDEALTDWFKGVKQRRNAKPGEAMEDVPQTQNEAVKEMFRGR